MLNVNVLLIGTRIFSSSSFSSSFSLRSSRNEVLEGWRRYLRDGVKQLNQIDYVIANIHKDKLYTHILVNLTRSSSQKLEYLLE